jgi:predicted GNAT family acetyltransferase
VSNATRVIKSRFEIEQDGQSSYLEFETDGHGWMTIWHTEVAKGLRGKGIGLELVTTVFQYAKEISLRVDVICPLAGHLVEKRPEFEPLIGSK